MLPLELGDVPSLDYRARQSLPEQVTIPLVHTGILSTWYTSVDTGLRSSLDVGRCERIFVTVDTRRRTVLRRATVWIRGATSRCPTFSFECRARVVQYQTGSNVQAERSITHVLATH